MKFNQKNAKSGAMRTLIASGGAVAANLAIKTIQEKAPESIAKYAAPIVGALCVAAPALGLVKSSGTVDALLLGAGVTSAIHSINKLTKDESGAAATVGIKGMLAKYVPNLSGVEDYNMPAYSEQSLSRSLMGGGEYLALPAAPITDVSKLLM
ncbi:hypothetical protein [Adhaeribacter pallidiroseus]|uniref:Holin n=1 Tax=Adhaeribacter pallidiroseus TaxID=2072847 RepID=A0A369QL42_9BACT|nr:hypothetical protein [Adhaeribacter pallidiroseus]RDC65060.1 hypothetical protein AHMF7616_03683 [Adhaeribacter pallidiroseus]